MCVCVYQAEAFLLYDANENLTKIEWVHKISIAYDNEFISFELYFLPPIYPYVDDACTHT